MRRYSLSHNKRRLMVAIAPGYAGLGVAFPRTTTATAGMTSFCERHGLARSHTRSSQCEQTAAPLWPSNRNNRNGLSRNVRAAAGPRLEMYGNGRGRRRLTITTLPQHFHHLLGRAGFFATPQRNFRGCHASSGLFGDVTVFSTLQLWFD